MKSRALFVTILSVWLFLLLQSLTYQAVVVVAGALGFYTQAPGAHGGTGGLPSFSPQLMGCSILISYVLLLGCLYLIGNVRWRGLFTIRSVRWSRVPLTMLLAILGILGGDVLSEALNLHDVLQQQMRQLVVLPVGILALSFAGPVVEEILFRDGIQGHLQRCGMPAWQTILYTSLLFGAVHLNWAQIPFAAYMGLILGIIYCRTGNIVVTTLIHIINNGMAVIMWNILGDSTPDFRFTDVLFGGHEWLSVPCAILCMAVSLLGVWRYAGRCRTAKFAH